MRLAAALILLLLLAGCSTVEPIENVGRVPIVTSKGKGLVLSEVAAAIRKAGQYTGWQVVTEGPGLFSARLERRGHVAIIEIQHDTRAYSIQYRDSTNLNAGNGQIHKSYNRWVENLNQAIRAELQAL